MREVNVIYESADLRVATCDRVLLTCAGSSGVTLDFLEVAHETGRRLGERYPEGIGSLTFLEPIVTLPAAPLRAAAAAATRASNAWVAAGATYVHGRGFRMAAVRSVLTAITLFDRGPPRKVFDDPGLASRWLTEQVHAASGTGEALVAWARRWGLLDRRVS